MSFQPELRTDGLTHASSVIPDVSRSDGASGMVTIAFEPLNTRAFPNFPAVVHCALAIVPVFAWPDRSPTLEPAPSSNEYAATRLGFVVRVRADATFE